METFLETFQHLSPTEQHEVLLKCIKPYNMDSMGSELHMCYHCFFKEYERAGSGCTREYHYCANFCNTEICGQCVDQYHYKLNEDGELLGCSCYTKKQQLNN